MQTDANWLITSRKTLGLTQKELADAIGVARNYIYLIESGRKPLSQKVRVAVGNMCNSTLTSTASNSAAELDRLAVLELRLCEVERRLSLICDVLERLSKLS